jgi:uncharacterized protein
MIFEVLVGAAAFAAGAVATVTGFGIGSILTPLFAMRTGTQLAVAAVSIPHFFATLLRFWRLREHVDRRVLLRFGITSAAGGLLGALLHNSAANRMLGIAFGVVLVFVGVSELSGLAKRMRFTGPVAWTAGAVSGFLGGLVGNQGGIRSAALLGFDIDKRAFVATATAVGVIVDIARMPAYFVTQWRELIDLWPLIAIATVAAILGTFLGERLLRGIPERRFRRVVAVLVLVLGGYMLSRFIPERLPASSEIRRADSTAVADAPGAP